MSTLFFGYLGYSLGVVILIIIVGGGVYLLLRPLVLWYFKIYTIESELQENNEILRDILDEVKKNNSQTQSSQKPQEDYSRYMPR